MVAHTQAHYPLPVEVAHHLHRRIPHPGRLRLFCFPGLQRLNGINRIHDPPLKRYRQLPLRRPPLPRKKPQEQSHRPYPGSPRPLLPADRFSAIGNSRFKLQDLGCGPTGDDVTSLLGTPTDPKRRTPPF